MAGENCWPPFYAQEVRQSAARGRQMRPAGPGGELGLRSGSACESSIKFEPNAGRLRLFVPGGRPLRAGGHKFRSASNPAEKVATRCYTTAEPCAQKLLVSVRRSSVTEAAPPKNKRDKCWVLNFTR